MNAVLILVPIFLELFVWIGRRLSTPHSDAQTALHVLGMRPKWTGLSPALLTDLANRLESPETAREFAEMCESTGILNDTIFKRDQIDPRWAAGTIASSLTSCANVLGGSDRYREAKRFLEYAIMVRPKLAPAWASMALVSMYLGDHLAAVEWADRVISFKPDPMSDDPWEAGTAAAMTTVGARTAADAIGSSEQVIGHDAAVTQMKAVRDFCQGKL